MNSMPSTWWNRNWKWFLPTGCLSLLVLAGAAVFGLVMLVFGMMKSSDAYRLAVAQAEHEPAVIAALGQPIQEGRMVSGNIRTSNDRGSARLAIPLSGPKGSGKLYVEAEERAGAWQVQALIFEDEQSHQRTTLTPTAPAAR